MTSDPEARIRRLERDYINLIQRLQKALDKVQQLQESQLMFRGSNKSNN